MAIRPKRARRLLVTGGSGFLGRHIVNGAASQAWELIAPSSASLDLRNAESVRQAVRDWKPAAIIHTAYRQPDRRSIVDATRNVAEAAQSYRSRLVHLSTDALFRGRMAPYTEWDEPNPVHQYGHDKADAERIVAATTPQAVIVRTSLLVGGSALSQQERLVIDAIAGRADTKFFTDEVRSPVLVDQLATALCALAENTDITGVLHLGGPEPMSRADLASLIAEHHGLDRSRLQFDSIEESGLTRPSRVVLDSALANTLGLSVGGPGEWR
jgi:dTDP-4-dehydrorhamnose reductase